MNGWERLRTEVDELNRLSGLPLDAPYDGYVGHGRHGWYGCVSYDAEPIGECAIPPLLEPMDEKLGWAEQADVVAGQVAELARRHRMEAADNW